MILGGFCHSIHDDLTHTQKEEYRGKRAALRNARHSSGAGARNYGGGGSRSGLQSAAASAGTLLSRSKPRTLALGGDRQDPPASIVTSGRCSVAAGCRREETRATFPIIPARTGPKQWPEPIAALILRSRLVVRAGLSYSLRLAP